MISKCIKVGVLGGIVLFASCNETQKTNDTTMSDNVLIQKWTGPYEGVPAFDKLSVEAIKPAIEEAIALNLAEIESIANNPNPPTF